MGVRLKLRLFLISGFGLAAATVLLAAGCTHAPKKDVAPGPATAEQRVPKQMRIYPLHKLIPYTLRVRRPPGEGANPKAGPGGTDYQSNPLPDAHYDCKDVPWLFSELNLPAVRACLARIQQPGRAYYGLRRVVVPYLELESDEETPACLKAVLSKIPLPREVFFQSTEGDRLACFSSRLGIEANEIAGFKLPMDKAAVKIELPLAVQPKDDNEARMLLMTWALTPFWSGGVIPSHLVPDAICVACLGEQIMLKPTDPEPLLWPE